MSIDTAPGAPPAVDLTLYAAEEILSMLGRRRMSRAELGRRLGGVSEAWVGRRLDGRVEIGLRELQRIAAILGVDALELLPRRKRSTEEYRAIGERVLAVGGAPRRARRVAVVRQRRTHRPGRAVARTQPIARPPRTPV